MDVITNLMGGFATCLSPYNLGMAALGAFLGTMVGILPGLGPSATMAISRAPMRPALPSALM